MTAQIGEVDQRVWILAQMPQVFTVRAQEVFHTKVVLTNLTTGQKDTTRSLTV
jgi:hypothetical protein